MLSLARTLKVYTPGTVGVPEISSPKVIPGGGVPVPDTTSKVTSPCEFIVVGVVEKISPT